MFTKWRVPAPRSLGSCGDMLAFCRRPDFARRTCVHGGDSEPGQQVWPEGSRDRGYARGGNDGYIRDNVITRGEEGGFRQAAVLILMAREQQGTDEVDGEGASTVSPPHSRSTAPNCFMICRRRTGVPVLFPRSPSRCRSSRQ